MINLLLPGGQVAVQGAFDVTDTRPTLAVTGKYQGAYGQLVETGSTDKDEPLVTLHLAYPR